MLGTTLVIKNYIMNVQYAMQLLNLFCNYQNLDPVKVFLFRQCEDKFCRPDEKKWPTYVSCIYLISLPVASCGIGFVVSQLDPAVI